MTPIDLTASSLLDTLSRCWRDTASVQHELEAHVWGNMAVFCKLSEVAAIAPLAVLLGPILTADSCLLSKVDTGHSLTRSLKYLATGLPHGRKRQFMTAVLDQPQLVGTE